MSAAKYVFPKALKELRIHVSQTDPASKALRSFIQKSYPTLKQNNPTTPILIREALGVQPTVYARFERGQEAKVHVDQVSENQMEQTLKSLIERSN